MNRCIFMGRLATAPELKTTPNGISVCTFRLAVERNYQKKGEEKKADFFNVVAWRASAEFVAKWFGKGRLILVEGELQTRQYTDKNGNPATWYEIIGENFYFTGEKKDSSVTNSVPQSPTEQPTQQSTNYGDNSIYGQGDTDDYPF